MRRKLSLFMGAVLLAGSLAGCAANNGGAGGDPTTGESGAKAEKKELTLLIDADTSMAGVNAVLALAEEKLGIKVEVETRVGGNDGSNIVKTRLASGDMSDLCVYNSGSNLSALNPSEYFIDISAEEFTKRMDDTFISSVTDSGKVFGVPLSASMAGGVLYSKPLYEKYNLEIPTTWDEFIKNCDVLKEAGEVAVIGTFADKWTTQVPFLGDHYNVLQDMPDFAEAFEAGTAKYATTKGGLRSFEKLAQLHDYYNTDYLATTYDDGCDMIANAGGGHWIILSQALSNIYELYGEKVDDIGIFGIPGEVDTGLTVWMSGAIYGNKNSGKTEEILEFMEFWVSDEALDAYTEAILPHGPYSIKGYELPDNTYAALKDIQSYYDAGKTATALEFQTAVKGPNCGSICQELGSGQTTPLEAAEAYDADCLKQAVQMGLDWE